MPGEAHAALEGALFEVKRVIVGQEGMLERLLVALLAGGHVLLEGVPGLAKTLMINTLAQLLSLEFKRIQFTPDLMPSDIVGTNVIEEDHTTGRRVTVFVPGPVFTGCCCTVLPSSCSSRTKSPFGPWRIAVVGTIT